MKGILDRVARSSSPALHAQYYPSNPREFLALRIAQKLNDAAAARHYAELAALHSEGQLLCAFRRAMNNGSRADLAARFHVELSRLNGKNGNGEPYRRLAAIRVERRAIAVVVLNGDRLEYPPLVRQLSSSSDKALESSAAFISRIVERCPFETAALEVMPPGEVQRNLLSELIASVLSSQGIAIWQVSKAEILHAFGYPPLRFRKQVREVISATWPDVNGGFGAPLVRDALALGLYCQVEYLFNLNLSSS